MQFHVDICFSFGYIPGFEGEFALNGVRLNIVILRASANSAV